MEGGRLIVVVGKLEGDYQRAPQAALVALILVLNLRKHLFTIVELIPEYKPTYDSLSFMTCSSLLLFISFLR